MLKSANEADQAIWTPFRRILTVQMSRKKIRDRLFLPHLSLSLSTSPTLSLSLSISLTQIHKQQFFLSLSLSFIFAIFCSRFREDEKRSHFQFLQKGREHQPRQSGKGHLLRPPAIQSHPTDRPVPILETIFAKQNNNSSTFGTSFLQDDFNSGLQNQVSHW